MTILRHEAAGRVILFGGGDGGGLIIGPHGVRPIPPFDPGLHTLWGLGMCRQRAVARRRDS